MDRLVLHTKILVVFLLMHLEHRTGRMVQRELLRQVHRKPGKVHLVAMGALGVAADR